MKTREERIRYLVKRGQLRSITILGRLAFARDDLDRFLAERQKDAQRKGR